MKVAITGTPGTGKTSVCRILSERLHLEVHNLNNLIDEFDLVIGRDEERESDIVDIDKLSEVDIPSYTLIEGHLSHNIKSVDFVIVLRCDPLELRERLKQKDWPDEKIKENLEAEGLGIIVSEAQEIHENVYEIDTTGIDELEVADRIIELINAKDRNKYKPRVDYLERLEEL